jgi:apolipoprotein N-acyltransferase
VPARLPRPLALVVAGLAGFVADLAFAPRGWWWAAILAIAVLHLAIRNQRTGFSFLVAATFGWVFMLRHLAWAVDAVGGGEVVPWIALSVLEGALLGLFGPLRSWAIGLLGLARRPFLGSLVASVVWVGVETLRSTFPFGGLPWGTLAFSQVDGPLLAFARYGGEPLVTGLVVVAGILVAEAASATTRLRPFRGIRLAATVVVIGLVGLLIPLPTAAQSGTVSVGGVQAYVPNDGLTSAAEARTVTADHALLTEQLLAEHPDLDTVLWAESAADVDPREDETVAASLDQATSLGVPVVFGTQRYLTDEDGTRNRYNEVLVWEPGVGPVGEAYASTCPSGRSSACSPRRWTGCPSTCSPARSPPSSTCPSSASAATCRSPSASASRSPTPGSSGRAWSSAESSSTSRPTTPPTATPRSASTSSP